MRLGGFRVKGFQLRVSAFQGVGFTALGFRYVCRYSGLLWGLRKVIKRVLGLGFRALECIPVAPGITDIVYPSSQWVLAATGRPWTFWARTND